MTPSQFKQGEFVRSIYTGRVYEIIEPNKKGMAKLKTENGYIEDWNADNNNHFVKFTGQLKMNF